MYGIQLISLVNFDQFVDILDKGSSNSTFIQQKLDFTSAICYLSSTNLNIKVLQFFSIVTQ